MPDAREYTSVVAAAEEAANAGDLASAETLLRQALQMQEARVGPVHADLVNPLNNLAVVCEARGNLREAERHFRRAYAVARTALPPDDPRVATSLQNLRDFCSVQGVAFESTAPVATTRPATTAPRPRPRPAQPSVPRGFVIALAVAALAGTALMARLWLRSEPSSPATATPSGSIAPPTEPPASVVATPPPAAPTPVPLPAAPAEPVAVAPPVAAPAAGSDVRVVTAQVCQALDAIGEWTCTPLASPATTGRVAFYTRLASAAPARVQHRWTQDGRVRQDVTLSIGASPSAGYRTFSRQTLTPGRWRVELRSAGGALLHEASFEVR